MNLGLTLVGSLLFLAPGLAFIVFRHLRGSSLVRRPLSSSGSVGVLVFAPIISSIAHGVALFLFGANEALVSAGHYLVTTNYTLDPYPTYVALLSGENLLETPGARLAISWALLYIVLLCWLTIVLQHALSWIRASFASSERRKGESSLGHLLRRADESDSCILIGAVRTRAPPYKGMSGWIGPLDVANLGGNDQLISIRLIRPSVFSINPNYPGNENETEFFQYDPPFETVVVHLEASEILSVEYFIIEDTIGSADGTYQDYEAPQPDLGDVSAEDERS